MIRNVRSLKNSYDKPDVPSDLSMKILLPLSPITSKDSYVSMQLFKPTAWLEQAFPFEPATEKNER